MSKRYLLTPALFVFLVAVSAALGVGQARTQPVQPNPFAHVVDWPWHTLKQ